MLHTCRFVMVWIVPLLCSLLNFVKWFCVCYLLVLFDFSFPILGTFVLFVILMVLVLFNYFLC